MAQRKQNFAARLKSAVRAFPSRAGAWLRSLVRPTEKDKARRRKVRRRFWQLILTVFLVGVISLCIVGSVLVIYVVRNFDAKDYLPEFDKLSMETRSVIFTQNAAGEWEPYQNLLGGNSVWTDLTDIPVDLQNAVIAIEDENFWQHDGVDWMRTVKATVNLALNRLFHIGTTEFGGSTITQQLIKITTQNDDHSIKRKVTEILTAIELEKNESSKQQVLEGYLNNMPMTGNLVGVGIGARYYFGKEVNELSLAECAVLASITNKPAYYDPYAHPEHVRQRQKTILGKMYELGMITRDEYVAAVNEELVFKNGATHQSVQDYYVDLVIEDVIADLMEEKGCTYAYAQNVVFYGGLNIYSAENPALQKRVEAIYADESNFPKHLAADDVTTDPETGAKKGHGDPQTAFFCIDNTGRVIATIGGRGQKEANRVLNRSTQSVRSPGSSIKPLSAYGPSIILNKVHYSSLVHDAPIIVGGKKWPHNYQKTTTPDNGWFTLGYAAGAGSDAADQLRLRHEHLPHLDARRGARLRRADHDGYRTGADGARRLHRRCHGARDGGGLRRVQQRRLLQQALYLYQGDAGRGRGQLDDAAHRRTEVLHRGRSAKLLCHAQADGARGQVRHGAHHRQGVGRLAAVLQDRYVGKQKGCVFCGRHAVLCSDELVRL